MVTATCVVCARQAHAWATFTLCSMVLLQHCLSPLLLLQLDLNITWQSCKHFLHIVSTCLTPISSDGALLWSCGQRQPTTSSLSYRASGSCSYPTQFSINS